MVQSLNNVETSDGWSSVHSPNCIRAEPLKHLEHALQVVVHGSVDGRRQGEVIDELGYVGMAWMCGGSANCSSRSSGVVISGQATGKLLMTNYAFHFLTAYVAQRTSYEPISFHLLAHSS